MSGENVAMATANGLVAPGLRDYNMRCRSLAQFKSQHDDNVPLSPIWESAFPWRLCLVYRLLPMFVAGHGFELLQ